MKKLIAAIAVAFACCTTFAAMQINTTNATYSTKYINAYDFKASLKVPYLYNGIRQYKSQTLNGRLFLEYGEDSTLGPTNVWIEAVNKSTKIQHYIPLTHQFYHLMGKSNKKIERTVPTVYFNGYDADVDANSHERITTVSFAGNGSIKTKSTTVSGCSACGGDYSVTGLCSTLNKLSGNVVGVMDCLCPENEAWDHTLRAGYCGIVDGTLDEIRTHYASFWGTWSAKFNEKASTIEEIKIVKIVSD